MRWGWKSQGQLVPLGPFRQGKALTDIPHREQTSQGSNCTSMGPRPRLGPGQAALAALGSL